MKRTKIKLKYVFRNKVKIIKVKIKNIWIFWQILSVVQ